MQTKHSNGVTQTKSTLSFNDTVNTVKSQIDELGFKTIADVDHSAAAASVDLSLLPSRLVIFGKPQGGTPLMQENSLFALDLPLKILIHSSENNETFVSYNTPTELALRHSVDSEHKAITMMQSALAKIVSAVV